MKKVLEMFGEPISYGGQESVVFNMLSSFDLNHDFKVDLFTPYFADNEYLLSLIKEHGGKVTSLGIPFKTNDNRFKLRMPVRKFFANAKDYDIVHIHSGSLTTMCVFANEAKRVGIKKVIVHSHTSGMRGNGFLAKIRKYILGHILDKYTDVYLACTKEALDSKIYNFAHRKSYIVNNGIDVEKYKFNEAIRQEIRDKYNLGNKFVIGSLGRIAYPKNNKFMIDILDSIINVYNAKDIMLMMVGDGDDLNDIKSYVTKKNIEDKVVFIGNTVDSYKFYFAFDTFIMPSLFEGFGITAVEAQINRLKCFLSDTIPQIVNISNGTTFLSVENKDVWANSILEYRTKEFNNSTRSSLIVDFDKFDRSKTYNIVKDIYLN